MLSERIKRLRDRQRSTTPTICLDRARLVTKYYQGVATEPNTLRRAKFFKYFLENRSIFIDPDSILAGHMASRLVGCPVFVDVLSWLSDEIDTAVKTVLLPGHGMCSVSIPACQPATAGLIWQNELVAEWQTLSRFFYGVHI